MLITLKKNCRTSSLVLYGLYVIERLKALTTGDNKGGVHMIPARLPFRYEFTPVPPRFHDSSTKSHTRASHTGASSPRSLYRSEIFAPVRKLVPMSCKRSTTVRSGMKSLSRESGMDSACVCLFNHTSADIWCLFR